MNAHKQRGTAHVLLIAILALMALSMLARCDIDNASADEIRPYIKHPSDGNNTPQYPEVRYEPYCADTQRSGFDLARHVDV